VTAVKKEKRSVLYRFIRAAVKFFYPVIETVNIENLPQEAAVIVGNHTQMHGPITCELYSPGKSYTWCDGQMMHLKEVPKYAYQSFWSKKPKYIRWFYKLLSYLIAPLSVCIFNHANTIGVYRDTRIMTTFKQTVQRLQEGNHVVIFPEHDVPHNHILCEFQDRFIDVAKLYYKRTGKAIDFVPMYIAPELKKLYLGKPIRFNPDNSMEDERKRICAYLMEQITMLACSAPKHRVVPYNNVPRREYPYNIP